MIERIRLIKKNFLDIAYYCFAISFALVMTATLMLMFVSPTGVVNVMEHNLVIRTTEIFMGIFVMGYSVILIRKNILQQGVRE